MSTERTKILNMLVEGKITVEEAEKLLDAIGEMPDNNVGTAFQPEKKGIPKYLRVIVDDRDSKTGKPERVNIRVPIQLLRAGLKLTSLIPDHARDKMHAALNEKGVNLDLNDFKPESLDGIIEALQDLTVDIDGEDEKVRIFCE